MTAAPTLSSEVSQADALDAVGRHQEALVQLVNAVHKQDVEALTRLGKRLLVGDRAPCHPDAALGFLADAQRIGGAEAPALRATLGIIHAVDANAMQQALNHLVVAAERGFDAARAQILVLAGRDPALAPGMATADWSGLMRGFDVAAWCAPPAPTTLHAEPTVCLINDFAPAVMCRWIIDRARARLERARVYDGVTGATTVHLTRTNSAAIFNLLDTDCVIALLQQRIARCLSVTFRYLEPAAVLHYAVGEEIKPHFDFVDPNVPNHDVEIAQRGQRVVTFLVYLNTDYADGETEFPRLGLSHKGNAGQALYFVNALDTGKADIRTLHAGRPPGSGEKWIVSQFIRNRPAL